MPRIFGMLCCVALILVTSSCAVTEKPNGDTVSPASAAAATVAAQEGDLLKRRMVWVHSMMCFPVELRSIHPYHRDGYGADAPLLQEMGVTKRTGMGGTAPDIIAAKAAGVDGFAVDVFTGGCGGYMKDAEEVGGFWIAPCLDLSCEPKEKKEAAAIRCIANHCKEAVKYKSAAKIGDAFLVFTYGTEQLPPEAWQRVRAALAEQGAKTYWVESCDTDGKLVHPKEFPKAEIEKYIPLFESGYCFGSEGMSKEYAQDLVDLFKSHGKPFFGGMMPGYYRVNGGYDNPRGTATYRTRWEKHLALADSLPWVCISTWNDYAENTNIGPSTDWSWTRPELTRWYTAKFKGEPLPWKEPRLYVSTPKHVYRKGDCPAEALVLNGGDKPCKVTIELLDGDGKRVGEPASADCPAGGMAAAAIPIALADFPAKRFLRAKAVMSVDGKATASCVSAPVCVFDETSMPGIPITYLSVPAHHRIQHPLECKIDGTTLNGQTATATVLASPEEFVKYMDLLHNNELVFRAHQAITIDRPVPKRTKSGKLASAYAWGFFVGREFDQDLGVGYSDPVYVAPEGDLNLWEHFAMDEGEGNAIKDSSIYGKVGELRNVTWMKPGFGDKGACLHFNGKDSFVDLRTYKTPTGSMSVKFAVRPAEPMGGFMYADRCGLWTEIDAKGRFKFVRNTSKGFVPLMSTTCLKPGEWRELEFVYDGAKSRILIDGKLDAEMEVPPGLPQGGHVIGYNPYGGSYFNGEIDELELRVLPEGQK